MKVERKGIIIELDNEETEMLRVILGRIVSAIENDSKTSLTDKDLRLFAGGLKSKL